MTDRKYRDSNEGWCKDENKEEQMGSYAVSYLYDTADNDSGRMQQYDKARKAEYSHGCRRGCRRDDGNSSSCRSG